MHYIAGTLSVFLLITLGYAWTVDGVPTSASEIYCCVVLHIMWVTLSVRWLIAWRNERKL